MEGLTAGERQWLADGAAGMVFVLNIPCARSVILNGSDEPLLALLAHSSRRDSPLPALGPLPGPEPPDDGAARRGGPCDPRPFEGD
jgi:hypothetical protein